MRIAACLAVLFTLLAQGAVAAWADLALSRLPLPDAIAGRPVTALHLDRQGFLWIASGSRLFRYDGERAVSVVTGLSGPVGSDLVLALHEDAAGAMYAITRRGVFRVAGVERLLPMLTLEPGDVRQVTAALMIGERWVLGLDSGEVLYVPRASGNLGGATAVAAVAVAEQSVVALLPIDARALRAYARDGSFRRLEWQADGLRAGHRRQLALPAGMAAGLIAVQQTATGGVIAGVAGVGVFATAPASSVEQEYLLELPLLPVLSDAHVNTLMVGHATTVVATDNGLRLASAELRQGAAFRAITRRNMALSHDEVISLHEAPTGELLLGTFEGVDVLRPSQFRSIETGVGIERDGARRVHALTAVGEGRVLVGTYAGGLLLDLQTGHLSAEPLQEAFSDHRVMSLGSDATHVLRGYRSRGLDVSSRLADGDLLHLDSSTQPALPGDAVTFVEPLGGGRWLVGFYGGGLALLQLDAAGPSVQPIPLPAADRSRYAIQACRIGADAFLLMTEGGPYRVVTGAEPSAQRVVLAGLNDVIDPTRLWLCEQDDNGAIWMASDTGLLLHAAPERSFAAGDGSALRFTRRFQLDSEIHAMRADRLGNLWAVARATVILVHADLSAVETFDATVGVPRTAFNYNSALRTADNQILFGSAEGLLHIDPARFATRRTIKPLSASWYRTEGHTETVVDLFTQPRHIQVRHPSSFFAIRLFAGTAINPGSARFRYRLDGRDDDWLYNGGSSTIVYSSLAGGDYRLRVQTSRDQAEWVDAEYGLGLTVTSDPLRSPAARIVYLLAVLLLLAVLSGWWLARRRSRLSGAAALQHRLVADRALEGLQTTLRNTREVLAQSGAASVVALDALVDVLDEDGRDRLNEQDELEHALQRTRLLTVRAVHAASCYRADHVWLDLHAWLGQHLPSVSETLGHDAPPLLINDVTDRPLPIAAGTLLALLLNDLAVAVLHAAYTPTQDHRMLRVGLTAAAGGGYLLEVGDNGLAGAALLALLQRDEGAFAPHRFAGRLGASITAAPAVGRVGVDVSAWLDASLFDDT